MCLEILLSEETPLELCCAWLRGGGDTLWKRVNSDQQETEDVGLRILAWALPPSWLRERTCVLESALSNAWHGRTFCWDRGHTGAWSSSSPPSRSSGETATSDSAACPISRKDCRPCRAGAHTTIQRAWCPEHTSRSHGNMLSARTSQEQCTLVFRRMSLYDPKGKVSWWIQSLQA